MVEAIIAYLRGGIVDILTQATVIAEQEQATLEDETIESVLACYQFDALPGNVRRLSARYQEKPEPRRRSLLAELLRIHGLI